MFNQRSKRRTIMVNPEFQVRLAFWGSIITVAEVMVGCVLVMLVALTNSNLSEPEQVNFFYKLIGIIGGVILVMTALNFVIALLFSHRIAGPMYRLRKSMEQVGTGDLSLLIRLRSGDELHELKDSFNDMVSSLRDKIIAVEQHYRQPATSKTKKAGATKKKMKKAVKQKKTVSPAPGFVWPFKID